MLTCYYKSSPIKPSKNYHYRLHRHCCNTNGNEKRNGFTIIEMLVVLLVIGIISGTAIGSYSSVIRDTEARSIIDRLQTYFQSCKNRAKLRKKYVNIFYNKKTKSFTNPDSVNSILKVPEIYSQSIPNRIDINKKGEFSIMGQKIEKLDLLFKTPSGNLATITIEL